MADDIVARLRQIAKANGCEAGRGCSEAADEIERLRAAGDALADDVDVALHSYSVGIYHTLAAWREARRG